MGVEDVSALLPYIITAGAAILAVLAAFFKGQSAGATKERAKQLQERMEARDVADEVDNDIGAVPPAEQRKELKTW